MRRWRGENPRAYLQTEKGLSELGKPDEGLGWGQRRRRAAQRKKWSKSQLHREVSTVRTEGLVASAGTFMIGWWGLMSCVLG